MEAWFDEVITKWKDEGLKINEGASTDIIKLAESFLNFQFPDDFKQMYSKMNGFEYLEWQKYLFSLWSIERMIEEFDPDKDFIGFSDHFLSANYLVFRKSRGGIYKIYSSLPKQQPVLIANNFRESVEMINTNSDLIY